jgi:membrane protein
MSKLKSLYDRLNRLSGGSLGVVAGAFQNFNDARGSEAAASMAYYAFFSLFPLLLVLIVAGSFVLQRRVVQQQIMGVVSQVLPVSQQIIQNNIQQVLKLRGTVGIVGVVSLLWSASGIFTTLADHIERAWSGTHLRGFVGQRLIALGIVISLMGLLILSVALNAVLGLLSRFSVPLGGNISVYTTPLWTILAALLPLLLRIIMFWGLYRLVPTAHVRWSAALVGAIVAGVGWQLITAGFSWYLNSGLARYDLVYGSLGTIVALMFWIYLSGWIILFGAHLSAAIDQSP